MKRTLEGIHNLRTVADGAADAWDTAPESHKKILRDCADSLMQAADEIERLPKTRNGAIFVLGKTELWARDDYSDPPLGFRLGLLHVEHVPFEFGMPAQMRRAGFRSRIRSAAHTG